MQLFIRQDCLRSSCGENCLWRDENRQGDITIGDFKGLYNIFPELVGTKRNYSTIIFNTEKGKSILSSIRKNMQLLPCDIDNIKVYNPLFYRHTYFSKNRDAFFAEFVKNPQKAIQESTTPSKLYRRSLKGRVFDFLPCSIRRWIIKGGKNGK